MEWAQNLLIWRIHIIKQADTREHVISVNGTLSELARFCELQGCQNPFDHQSILNKALHITVLKNDFLRILHGDNFSENKLRGLSVQMNAHVYSLNVA